MLKWFNDKKQNKLYAADIKTLEEIHSKIVVLTDKKAEILAAEGLSDDERAQLTGMLDTQIEIVNKDALIYGATLSHYFEGNKITRIVPKGVDLTQQEFCYTEKVTEDMLEYVSPFSTTGEGVSNMTDRIIDRMVKRDTDNEVSETKLKTISKLPLKGALKVGLKKIHTDKMEERKEKLEKYVKGVNPPLPALKREAKIIKKVVLETINRPNQYNLVTNLSTQIASVEASLKVHPLYKTFLNADMFNGVDFSNQFTNEFRDELKKGWIDDLRETGDFVLTLAPLDYKGKRTGTQSTGPQ